VRVPGVGSLFWPLGFAALLGLIWAEELSRVALAMQSRIFLALFLALVGPAAVAWLRLDGLRLPRIAAGRVVAAGVVLCLALTLVGQAAQTLTLDNLAALAGAQGRDAYLAQQLDPYAAAMRRLDALGPRARVLLLWEPRSYLTDVATRPDPLLDNFHAFFLRCGGDASTLARCLRAAGFTHVLLDQEGVSLLRAEGAAREPSGEAAALDRLRATWPSIYRDDVPLVGPGLRGTGWYVLYALDGAGAPAGLSPCGL
jgi:hypothetical protein